MHGLPFALLHTSVEKDFQGDWKRILAAAGLSQTKLYFTNEEYPDEEFFRIAQVVCERQHVSLDDLLLGLGKRLAQHFFVHYSETIDPKWKALDLLEKSPVYINTLLKATQQKLPKAQLRIKRASSHVILFYSSPRKVCSLVEGAIRGVLEHYGEPLSIEINSCMNQGYLSCEFIIKDEHSTA